MERIKDTLLLLCNFLNKLFDERVVSVHFSHAKFDRTNDHVVHILWNVIHKMVCKNRPICNGGNSSENTVNCTKKTLLMTCGYKRISFYALPVDCSYGSRELLIALGKLIIDGKLEEYLDKLVSESVLISEFGKLHNTNHKITDDPTDDIIESTLDTLLFKAGKIKKILKNLELLKQRRLVDTVKVHGETSSVPCVSYLSALEVLVLSKKKLYYVKYQKQLLHISGLMDAYFLWIKRKKQFAAWLETVIDLKEDLKDDDSWKETLKDFTKTLSPFTETIEQTDSLGKIQDAVSTMLEEFEAPMTNNGFKILQ